MSVEDFQNVLRLQRVIILRYSIGFQCNLVHKQITLSPTRCSKKIYDLFLSFLHNFGFSENSILQIIRRVLDCKSGEFGVWILYQTHKLASHLLFQSMA